MFCVECGKETAIYKNGVCKDCYVKSKTFTDGPKYIDVTYCGHCNSYKYKNTWTTEDLNSVLVRFIKDAFQISKELKNVEITIEQQKETDSNAFTIYITGMIEDVEVEEKHEIILRLKKTVCDVCSKRFGGYHEAILQIRADQRKLSDERKQDIKTTVEGLVESHVAKGNRGLFITDIGYEHGGIDFYLSDKNAASSIVKKLHETYGGEIKKSSKNIGMKDSKQVYRMTFLLRLPNYKKNDFIKMDDSYYLVVSLYGNKVHMIDLKTWEKTIIGEKELQKIGVVGGKELTKELILVSQTKKEVQVMDPESYKISEINKPKPFDFTTEKINTVQINDSIFLLPEPYNTNK